MAVASASAEAIDLASPVDRSVSKLPSDAASDSSSSRDLCSSETPDRNYPSTSSPNPSRDAEIQSLEVQRSEEYRQLFRLPPEEVLVQDFNCAYQESILLQGHMYLFFHYICFYSNIFGFETKKIIPFHEVTSVKRAKTAGIFPTAIEIIAAGRKYFFASFLSRDEAFKLINEGWEQHGDGDKQITEQQGSISDSSPGSGSAAIERVNSSKHTVGERESVEIERVNSSKQSGSELESADGEKDSLMVYADIEYDVEPDPVPVVTAPSTSADDACLWKPENSDAPNIPECYTNVAEAQFQITVQDFFDMFFSDNAVSFVESFHRKCGDKEFRCSSWYPHEKFGHARDVSFQHPIKIYFGAKFGSCQEVQKFRIYRDSHLIIETSQEINDVPYGDYFQVEGLWDVHRDTNGSSEFCVLRIYVNVAFSKRTVWKGKIVQSTQEECREAYATWIEMAQELLKQKHENKEEPTVNSVSNGELKIEKEHIAEQHSERMHDLSTHSELHNSNSVDVSQRVDLFQTCLENVISISSQLKEYAMRSYSSLQSRSQVSLVLATAFVVIFLMQVSILVLLSRPQQIHMVPATEYAGGIGVVQKEFRSAEAATWLERRLQYLKEDVVMVEARLERLQDEHAALKRQIKDLEQLRRRQAHMA